MAFWQEYAQGSGNKVEGRVDAVQALHERRMKDRQIGNSVKQTNLMSAAVAAVSGFKKCNTYDVRHGITGKTKDMMRKYAEMALTKKSGGR